MARCPNGGEPKDITAALEQPVIENFLAHLGARADTDSQGGLLKPARKPRRHHAG